MQIFRTFFKKEIFAEFMVPSRRLRGASASQAKVVIICSGVPGVPTKRTLMEFFVKKGYWAFHIRYRGTWESKGTFLKESLEQDLLDVVDELPKGFVDLWTKTKYKVNPKTIIITGSSFGGPAVILASRDPRVTKAIAFSPVVDWLAPSEDEPTPQFVKYMQEAYGMVYRTTPALWRRLVEGKFYQVVGHEREMNPSKLMIIHAKDDHIVRLKEVAQFANKSKAHFVLLNKGGHLSSSTSMDPAIWKKISKFLKTTTTRSRKNS